jgi:hypothetical protein
LAKTGQRRASTRQGNVHSSGIVSIEVEIVPIEVEIISIEMEIVSIEMEIVPIEMKIVSIEMEIVSIEMEIVSIEVEIVPIEVEIVHFERDAVRLDPPRRPAFLSTRDSRPVTPEVAGSMLCRSPAGQRDELTFRASASLSQAALRRRRPLALSSLLRSRPSALLLRPRSLRTRGRRADRWRRD